MTKPPKSVLTSMLEAVAVYGVDVERRRVLTEFHDMWHYYKNWKAQQCPGKN